jgi:Co/Zn/Cd efflux system component
MLLLAASIIEAAGFFATNSISLLSDSYFLFTEFLFFLMICFRLKSKRVLTFSLFASLSAFVAALFIIYAAVFRFVHGGDVSGLFMPPFALAGFLASAFAMRRGRGFYGNKNAKESFLLVSRKTASSALVIAGGLWIALTGEMAADYVLAVLIAFAVMFESIRLFRDASCVLLGEGKSKTYLFKNVA